MMKAVKKLKFWSKKKRNKKRNEHAPQSHCCCSSTQPSAPPLPSSSELDAEYNFNYGTFSPNSSYQQYVASISEPVYGIPVTTTRRERSTTHRFGCVFTFGSYFFRCLFPCFHIPQL
ncbi:hypothetical protein VNO78_33242 [Psophocarpus tetragonolobus]|uniref:Uncharacterized protein n=1 Tax=Psophocarpus tetragonolobus TaxID=3891 RepID=A0AAN9NWX8_PSOTE